MASIWNNILGQFKKGNILVQIILLNVVIFLVLAILNLVTTLFKLPSISLLEYIGVPSHINEVLSHFWTILTYMFVHYDLLHIFFNMLILYVFGKIFLLFFTPKQMGAVYLLGGICGALVYLLAFNTIPYYLDFPNTYLVGASASVTAILFAAATYRPNMEIRFFFIPVKIIYVAGFIFLLDFLALGSPANPGGHIAHIGGAIFGILFARQYLKGKDITRWMTQGLDKLANLFKPRPAKMKVKQSRPKTDQEYNREKYNDNEEVDRILDKIKKSGYAGLSSDEKKRLFDASKK